MIVEEKTALPLNETFIKVVVDIERRIASIGCDLHIDCADELLSLDSASKNLWGANIYPKDKKIEFISLINIRPSDNNRNMEIQNPEVRKKVEEIIKELFF